MSQRESIEEQLRALMCQEGILSLETTLDSETRFDHDLGLDSMEMIQFIMALNHAFKIEIKSREIIPEHFSTFETLVQLIRLKLRQ